MKDMPDSEVIHRLRILADKMRLKALEMAYRAGSTGAHIGPALSCIEILACIYGAFMAPGNDHTQFRCRNVFIPSKAHCVLSLYTALAYTGHFSEYELDTFELDGSELTGHPVMNPTKGIEFSGGSLGMGPSQAIGLALAFRRKGLNGNVFVLLGDGECDEGAVWEAAMCAAHFKLDNIIFIIDKNKLQYDGPTEDILALGNLSDKFRSFGFDVNEVDGHNVEELYSTLRKLVSDRNQRPKAVVALTVKGKGVSFMENKKEWHHARLSKPQYEMAVKELTSRT